MTPGERDEVRAMAQVQIDHHRATPLVSQANKDGCRCTDCQNARAVLRYVPPGDFAAPAGFTLQPVAATADTPASVVTVSPKGRFWPLDVEMARQMGAAYMAAADAAEED